MPYGTFFLFFSGAVLELAIQWGCPLYFLAANELVGRRAAEKQKEKGVWFAAIYKQATPTGFEQGPGQGSLWRPSKMWVMTSPWGEAALQSAPLQCNPFKSRTFTKISW